MDGANRALEGTCSGDVVGGLLLWTGENLQALLFLTPRARRVRLKRTSLIPARGLTSREILTIRGITIASTIHAHNIDIFEFFAYWQSNPRVLMAT